MVCMGMGNVCDLWDRGGGLVAVLSFRSWNCHDLYFFLMVIISREREQQAIGIELHGLL